MSLKAFEMPFEDFLNCNIFDVDIKTDYNQESYEYNQTCIQKRKIVKGSKLFKNKDGTVQGIQYGKREQATPSTPFVKTYSKGLELATNSLEFKKKYLPAFFDDTLRRTEVTVQNATAIRTLVRKGVLPYKPQSLKEWLSLGQDVYLQIILHQVHLWEREYNFEQIRKKQEDKPISSSNYLLLRMYEILKKDGYKLQDIANLMDSYPSPPEVLSSQKSRIKTKFKNFDNIINNTSEQLRSLEVYSYL